MKRGGGGGVIMVCVNSSADLSIIGTENQFGSIFHGVFHAVNATKMHICARVITDLWKPSIDCVGEAE